MLLQHFARTTDESTILRISGQLDFSKWFLLLEIGSNCIYYNTYAFLLDGIDRRLKKNDTEVKHTIKF
jgi:hypothetical protein